MSEAISNAIAQQLERQHRSCQRPVRHTMGRSGLGPPESRRTDDDDARVGAYTLLLWTCIFREINPVEVKTWTEEKPADGIPKPIFW
jgi:hypothetical protein